MLKATVFVILEILTKANKLHVFTDVSLTVSFA